MKLNIYTLLLALCVTWILQSCDNDDDNSIAVPTELQNAFSSKYPNAANVKWETKSGYYVADFYDGYEASAWFTQEGKWVLTSWEVHFNTLPDPVKNTIHATYPGRVDDDDTEYVEEATGATYYLIDIENSEIDVKIRADGQILD